MALASADILTAKQRRLHQLELRQAQTGDDTPPHIAIEIADLRRDLAAAAPLAVAESHDILYDLVMRLNSRIDRLYWWILLLAVVIILAVKL